MMSIGFSEIPVNLRVPGVLIEIDGSQASRGALQQQGRVMLIGQKLAAGSAAANEPRLVTSLTEAYSLFGVGSHLVDMVEAFRANDGFTQLWALPVADNGAGTAATGTLTITGPATSSGVIQLYLGGRRIQVPVALNANATTIATAVAAAINAEPRLAVTATSALGVVTLTHKHKGTIGNDYDVRVNYLGASAGEVLPGGVAVAVVAMAGGAGDPSLATALANVPDEIWSYWVLGNNDTASLDALRAELDDRFLGTKMLEGFGFYAKRGTVGALQTFGLTRNDKLACCLGYNDSPTPPHVYAAAVAGAIAIPATNDPFRPFLGLQVRGVLAPATTSRFKLDEQNTLLFSGVSTFDVQQDGTVRISKLITTYQKDAQNVLDPTWLSANTPLCASYLRQDFRAYVAPLLGGRFKIVDNDTPTQAGSYAINQRVMEGYVDSWGLAKQQAGQIEDYADFVAKRRVVRSTVNPGRFEVVLPPNLVNGLEQIFAVEQFYI